MGGFDHNDPKPCDSERVALKPQSRLQIPGNFPEETLNPKPEKLKPPTRVFESPEASGKLWVPWAREAQLLSQQLWRQRHHLGQTQREAVEIWGLGL